MAGSNAAQVGATIANTALQYKGRPYRWAGARPSGWDCSGFVNYVLGNRLGMTLPGGITGFTGATHGPVAASYVRWKYDYAVSSPMAGDLCIWVGVGPLGHIGIAVSTNEMISALDPAKGTAVTPIKGTGPRGAPLVYRRVTLKPGTIAAGTGTAPQLPAGCAKLVAGAGLAAAGVPVGLWELLTHLH